MSCELAMCSPSAIDMMAVKNNNFDIIFIETSISAMVSKFIADYRNLFHLQHQCEELN